MAGWIVLLISLVAVVLATLGRTGAQAAGHGQMNRTGGHRKPVPDQRPRFLDEATTNSCKGPRLENSSVYHGEIFFFCSTVERDAFTANLDQFGEYHPSESSKNPRAIDRPN